MSGYPLDFTIQTPHVNSTNLTRVERHHNAIHTPPDSPRLEHELVKAKNKDKGLLAYLKASNQRYSSWTVGPYLNYHVNGAIDYTQLAGEVYGEFKRENPNIDLNNLNEDDLVRHLTEKVTYYYDSNTGQEDIYNANEIADMIRDRVRKDKQSN
jgi:hypothetical protein